MSESLQTGQQREYTIGKNTYHVSKLAAHPNFILFCKFQAILGDPAVKLVAQIAKMDLSKLSTVKSRDVLSILQEMGTDIEAFVEIAVRACIALVENDPKQELIFELLKNSAKNDRLITSQNVNELFNIDTPFSEYIAIIKESIKVHIVPLYAEIGKGVMDGRN